MNPIQSWLDRHLRRLAWGRFLEREADVLAVFLFVFGGAVLIAKLLRPELWPHVLWLTAASVPLSLVAWWWSRRNAFTRSESVALLDRRIQAGGLLMTLAELPDPSWSDRLPQVQQVWAESLPKIRPVRFARNLSLPLIFAVGACFVPLREAQPQPVLPNVVGQQASEQLEQMLDWMKDSQVLPEEEQRQIREEIAKLAADTEHTPLTHEKWETVDALRERMQLRLETAALTAQEAHEAAAALARAADGPELNLDTMLQLEQNLAEMLMKLQEQGAFSGAPESLRRELERLIKQGQFKLPADPAERQELLDELEEYLDQEWEKLNELRQKCGDGRGGACLHCGSGFCEGSCEGNGRDGDGPPGRGGVNRGRGDAPITFGDESDERGTKFKEVVLPPGFLDDPKNEVLGITRSAPEEAPAESAPRDVQRQFDPSAGRETWSRQLRPRHRSVVRGYFNTDSP